MSIKRHFCYVITKQNPTWHDMLTADPRHKGKDWFSLTSLTKKTKDTITSFGNVTKVKMLRALSTAGHSVGAQECKMLQSWVDWLIRPQAFGSAFISSMSASTISFTSSCRGTQVNILFKKKDGKVSALVDNCHYNSDTVSTSELKNERCQGWTKREFYREICYISQTWHPNSGIVLTISQTIRDSLWSYHVIDFINFCCE